MALHVVALSGGKDSTAMALRLAEVAPRDYVYVCTPTGDEPPEMFAHWRMLGEVLGNKILPVMGGTLDGLIRRQNALPNWRQRWCTRMLKIDPYAAWLTRQIAEHGEIISYVGLRADEETREGGDYTEIPGVTQVYPMRDWGWGLNDVLDYLRTKNVSIPIRTDCLKCFYQRLIEWWEFWHRAFVLGDEVYKAAWVEGEAWELLTGYTLRSPGRDTWPAALKDLRVRFESGDVPRDTRPDHINKMKCRVCTK